MLWTTAGGKRLVSLINLLFITDVLYLLPPDGQRVIVAEFSARLRALPSEELGRMMESLLLDEEEGISRGRLADAAASNPSLSSKPSEEAGGRPMSSPQRMLQKALSFSLSAPAPAPLQPDVAAVTQTLPPLVSPTKSEGAGGASPPPSADSRSSSWQGWQGGSGPFVAPYPSSPEGQPQKSQSPDGDGRQSPISSPATPDPFALSSGAFHDSGSPWGAPGSGVQEEDRRESRRPGEGGGEAPTLDLSEEGRDKGPGAAGTEADPRSLMQRALGGGGGPQGFPFGLGDQGTGDGGGTLKGPSWLSSLSESSVSGSSGGGGGSLIPGLRLPWQAAGTPENGPLDRSAANERGGGRPSGSEIEGGGGGIGAGQEENGGVEAGGRLPSALGLPQLPQLPQHPQLPQQPQLPDASGLASIAGNALREVYASASDAVSAAAGGLLEDRPSLAIAAVAVGSAALAAAALKDEGYDEADGGGGASVTGDVKGVPSGEVAKGSKEASGGAPAQPSGGAATVNSGQADAAPRDSDSVAGPGEKISTMLMWTSAVLINAIDLN